MARGGGVELFDEARNATLSDISEAGVESMNGKGEVR